MEETLEIGLTEKRKNIKVHHGRTQNFTEKKNLDMIFKMDRITLKLLAGVGVN